MDCLPNQKHTSGNSKLTLYGTIFVPKTALQDNTLCPFLYYGLSSQDETKKENNKLDATRRRSLYIKRKLASKLNLLTSAYDNECI